MKTAAVVLLLALAARGDEPIALYGGGEGCEVEHRCERGAYLVSYRLSGLVRAPAEGEAAPVSQWVPLPELGRFDKPQVQEGALLRARATVEAGGLRLELTPAGYRPPSGATVLALEPTEARLAPIADALAKAWTNERGRKLQAACVNLCRRRQGVAAQRLLAGLAHCYAGEVEEAARLGEGVLRELARLVEVEPSGEPAALARAVGSALCGYRVTGRFVPEAAARRAPTRGGAGGEVGRAVLRGVLDPAEGSDWWELVVSRDAVVRAIELPAGLALAVVHDPAEPQRLHLRVIGRPVDPAPYAIEVLNKHGQEARWVELYERLPDAPELPY